MIYISQQEKYNGVGNIIYLLIHDTNASYNRIGYLDFLYRSVSVNSKNVVG